MASRSRRRRPTRLSPRDAASLSPQPPQAQPFKAPWLADDASAITRPLEQVLQTQKMGIHAAPAGARDHRPPRLWRFDVNIHTHRREGQVLDAAIPSTHPAAGGVQLDAKYGNHALPHDKVPGHAAHLRARAHQPLINQDPDRDTSTPTHQTDSTVAHHAPCLVEVRRLSSPDPRGHLPALPPRSSCRARAAGLVRHGACIDRQRDPWGTAWRIGVSAHSLLRPSPAGARTTTRSIAIRLPSCQELQEHQVHERTMTLPDAQQQGRLERLREAGHEPVACAQPAGLTSEPPSSPSSS